jgi:hypothetical protein
VAACTQRRLTVSSWVWRNEPSEVGTQAQVCVHGASIAPIVPCTLARMFE